MLSTKMHHGVTGAGWMAAVLVCAGLALPQAAIGQAGAGAAPPMQVGVISVEKQDVPRVFSLPGRAVAYQQVSIRPRISGVVTEILYDPAVPLNEGDALFRLDDASYVASVAADEAAVASAEADVPVAQAAYDRAKRLEGSGATTATVEQARATLATSKASLQAARAALEYSRTQLSWAEIKSPIRGLAEVASVSVGDLVTSGQTDAMTTVTRLDPIDVTMLETSARILSVRAQIDSGTLAANERLNARLILENGETFDSAGSLVAMANSVSTSTGTTQVRFRFDNPDRKVIPGMFLRGEIELGTVQAFLVPQRATSRSNTGQLTAFIIGDDGAAEQVEFSEIGSYQNNWIVLDGISDGDQLIVDGLKTMRAGTMVTPVASQINADGLVQDAAPAATANTAATTTTEAGQ